MSRLYGAAKTARLNVLRLRLGTTDQLRSALRLRLAVATIQVYWRRRRNARMRKLSIEYTRSKRAPRVPPQPAPQPAPPTTHAGEGEAKAAEVRTPTHLVSEPRRTRPSPHPSALLRAVHVGPAGRS